MIVVEILKSILYGLIQGITEWLPISSTGHLIMLHSVLPLNIYEDAARNIEFWNMYKIVIQVGSILAVIVLFWNRLWPFTEKKSPVKKKSILRIWGLVLLGSIPMGILGIVLNDFIDSRLSSTLIVGITLIIYGVIILIAELRPRKPVIKEVKEITPVKAYLTGCVEALCLIPGTSRSGAAILGGLMQGMNRTTAVEFSFYLAVPAMLGAAFLKLIRLKIQLSLSGILVLVSGIIMSFFVSLLVVRSLLNYVRNHDMRLFGYYRIVLGLVILILAFLGALPEGLSI